MAHSGLCCSGLCCVGFMSFGFISFVLHNVVNGYMLFRLMSFALMLFRMLLFGKLLVYQTLILSELRIQILPGSIQVQCQGSLYDKTASTLGPCEHVRRDCHLRRDCHVRRDCHLRSDCHASGESQQVWRPDSVCRCQAARPWMAPLFRVFFCLQGRHPIPRNPWPHPSSCWWWWGWVAAGYQCQQGCSWYLCDYPHLVLLSW